MRNRILIAEDHPKIREWLVSQFKAQGFQAVGVEDGVAALAVLLKGAPDALVLDLHLPKMHGIEVLRRLRASDHGKNMPVVVITGVYKDTEHATKAKESFKIDAYIVKPFKIEILIGAVKKAIEDHSQAGAQTDQPESVAAVAQQAAPQPAQTQKVITGNLAQKPFDHLLLQIWNERLTGVLRIKSPDPGGGVADRAFAFLSGKPVLGRSNAQNEDFGTHLMNRGLVTPVENREFQYLLANGARDAEDIFIRMGCLTPDGFIIERVRHLEELLIYCFALADGDFKFQESQIEIASVVGALVPRVFHEGYRRHLTEQRMGLLFHQMRGEYLSRTALYYDYLPALELDPEERKTAELVTGSKMLKDLVEGDNFHKTLKLLVTFLALGMVQPNQAPKTEKIEPPYPIRPEQAAAQQQHATAPSQAHAVEQTAAQAEEAAFEDLSDALSDELGDLATHLEIEAASEPQAQTVIPLPVKKSAAEDTKLSEEDEHRKIQEELKAESARLKNINYYEYFDLKPNRFRFEDMKTSYFAKRKKFSPENFMWADGETMSVAEQVFTQLTTAYNTLSNVVSKEKYDELVESTLPKVSGDAKVDRFQAQVQYESGKAFIEMAEWDSAEQALREAIDLNPRDASVHAWLAWAVYSKDKIHPANIQRAKQELVTALKMDPRLSIAFAFRGTMLLDEGNLDAAEVELKRALKFNPNSKHARRELKNLELRRESQKKGIIGRIFS